MTQTVQLDHVIALLPYEYITTPPTWLTDNFVVSPGGVHADGKTENKLILFRDGTYLELIAFINDDPEKRKGHWWDKKFGVVDFAYTTPESFDYDSLQARLNASGTSINYEKPQHGARTRPDGVKLEWMVTFPQGVERGEVPFWCHDVTPRERRVPITEANTTHPCGALGMAGMRLGVCDDSFERLKAGLTAITSSEDINLDTPNVITGLRKPSISIENAGPTGNTNLSLVLRTGNQQTPKDIRHFINDGVVSIVFENESLRRN